VKQIPPHILWPGMVVALLLMSVVMVTITVTAAVNDPSFAVDPDYYKEHIDWNARKQAQAASDALGWEATITVASSPNDDGLHSVELVLRDRDGQPVEGAVARADTYHYARAHQRYTLSFVPMADKPGHYVARAPINHDGIWAFELKADKGQAHYLHTVKRTLSGIVPGQVHPPEAGDHG